MKVALIQFASKYLDIQANLEFTLSKIDEAAAEGAQLIVFGESWFGGYPAWIDYCPDAALWDQAATKSVFRKMHENTLSVPSQTLNILQKKAKEKSAALCFGANELAGPSPGRGTLYNSLFIINEKGELAVHHRKLMPTYTEKLVYGLGDGAGLKATNLFGYPTTGLICWEHWMPLTRQALHLQGELIHIAVWPTVHDAHQLASRHYAFEGRCFVLAVGQLLRVRDLPEELSLPDSLSNLPDHWLLRGGSAVITPQGEYLLEPVFEKEKILYAEFDPAKAIEEKMTLDVAGHYNRPDVFELKVRKDRIRH
ncbi:MAG: carbon-nitrogen hydrolase family protein [Bacteroidota bacterium]